MPKNSKLKLSELKVQSFVTLLGKDKEKRILAAGTDEYCGASETGRDRGLCCAVFSAANPSLCEERTVGAYCAPM